MAHLENRLDWCFKKVKKEGVKHKGLKKIEPDSEKADKHIKKAQKNLSATMYLLKGDFPDWAVNASFYAMYHCLLALLAKHGYESRNQLCTFLLIEKLIGEKKIEIELSRIKKIATFDDDLEEEDVITLREESQYGTEKLLDNEEVKQLIEETKEFIEIVRGELGKD